MYKSTAHVWQSLETHMFKLTVLGSMCAALGISGCSSTPSTGSSPAKQTAKQVSGATQYDIDRLDSIKDPLEDLLSATDMRAVEGDRLLILKHGDVWKRMTVGFKMNLDQKDSRIAGQRSWFISRQPYIDRLSARASRYLYHTVKEAERRGLPTELALLPIIESSYDPAATSSAAAAGLWQFIPSTGKIYGLKQNSNYDGRRDVVESTRAAYEFLGSLYNQFGSWELALASYNAGPGRIQQAINRNKAAGLPTDYWSLKLPQETMNYVPRFIAVAQIIKNPSAYGVSLPPIANRPHFREITVGPASLNDISNITGLTRAELYALNPGYRGDYIDKESPMRILVPADLNPSLDARLRSLGGANTGTLLAASASSSPAGSVTFTPTKAAPPALNSAPKAQTVVSPSVNQPVSVISGKTPQGSAALAAFAAQSDIPSAPRVPVAVTPAQNVQPVSVEPPISESERRQILAMMQAEGASKTASVDDVLKPVASQAEQAQIVAELKQLAPQGTEIVDPTDGKIKLTAIQTSLSVAEQQGKELTKGFAYPKAVADTTSASSDEAKRNQGKNVIKTDSEVVVVAPSGKRSVYTVAQGDTLVLIAMKHGLNWRDVAQWNQIDPSATLYAGTRIYLYDAKPQQSEPKPMTVPDTYIVKANDTLSGVANQFGLSLKQLADYNQLSTSSGIFVGQKLALKETAATVVSPKAESAKVATKTYTVQRGEYLKLIADRYALSNQELANLTQGLTATSALIVGQKINVPVNEVAKAKTKLVANVTSQAMQTEQYTVQRGDTLSSVAQQTKLSIAELASLNGLSTQQGLRVGQQLKIPVDSLTPETYVVKAGDTLSGIASRYALKTDYVAKLNNISQNANVRLGQKLRLTETNEPIVVNKVATQLTAQTPDTHVVKAGETLSSIAKKYFLQVNYLAELNDLPKNGTVKTGQRLKLDGDLPKKVEVSKINPESQVQTVLQSRTAKTEAYTVKAGESLNAIAQRLDISVTELATLNSLSPKSGLRVGQSLVIPKKFTDYKIKRGDTLIGLASRYGMDTQSFAQLNDLTPTSQLRIGQVIQVPNL